MMRLFAEARKLSRADIVRLVRELSDAIEDDSDVRELVDLSPAWRAEIRRRVEGIENGTAKTRDAWQALAEIKASRRR
jgi:putative addiction module component (TIGR02574 family)